MSVTGIRRVLYDVNPDSKWDAKRTKGPITNEEATQMIASAKDNRKVEAEEALTLAWIGHRFDFKGRSGRRELLETAGRSLDTFSEFRRLSKPNQLRALNAIGERLPGFTVQSKRFSLKNAEQELQALKLAPALEGALLGFVNKLRATPEGQSFTQVSLGLYGHGSDVFAADLNITSRRDLGYITFTANERGEKLEESGHFPH